MKKLSTLFFALILTFSLAACSGEADIEVDAEDTLNTPTDTAGTPDLAPEPSDTSSAGDTTGGIGDVTGELGSEGVEKLVETQLIAKAGFENVTVESKPGGVIVLNGSVKTAAEKTDAEAEAKKVAGVTSVENNLTVSQ